VLLSDPSTERTITMRDRKNDALRTFGESLARLVETGLKEHDPKSQQAIAAALQTGRVHLRLIVDLLPELHVTAALVGQEGTESVGLFTVTPGADC
jgi:hypothetical protein